jgi:hypothetical protein
MKNATAHKPDMSMTALERELRAKRPHFATSHGFTDRVMENLGPMERPVRTRHPAVSWRFIAGFSAVSAVLLIALVQALPRSPQLVTQTPTVTEEPQISTTQDKSGIYLAKVEELTARLDEPLEKELQNVISDTRQAIQFVASNFLP